MTTCPIWYDVLTQFESLIRSLAGQDWQDLRQEVAASLFRKYGSQATVEPGIIVSRIHQCHSNACRKRRRRVPESTLPVDGLDQSACPDCPAEFCDLELRDLLAILPDSANEILSYRVFTGLTFPEIAGRLGRRLESVKSECRRAVDSLKLALSGEGN